ncbi:helix-turn-helix transcriptional regulator [Providencia rettgeri]|nr:helix-turn-helix transcriptional regulator [Providencia rettgeri]ELL9156087.1 helix-turn-helix transcriptional regulator [Providencia rettgeri]
MQLKYIGFRRFFSSYSGKAIRKIRKDKGYTGKELASQLNLSQQQISRYERGENQLTIDVLFNVFIILDVSLPSFINYLFDEIVLNHPDNLDVVRLKIEPIDSIFLIWDKKH